MKRPVQCAEQQVWPSNLTKHCACQEKWLPWLILMTYQTSFAMRTATGLTLEPYQILRLPPKMTRMIDARHIWNVIYNARSNRTHPPTSPNTAPATQICTPKSKRNLPKTVQASFTMADDSRMVWTWSEHEIAKLNPAVRRAYSATHFVLNITIFRAAAIYPKFTKYCACHEKWHSNITKCCACHLEWLSWLMPVAHETSFTIYNAQGIRTSPSNVTKYCACHVKWHAWLMPVTYETSLAMHRASGPHPPTSPNTAPAT